MGTTRDDAAGECFDKAARVLGLPYPGGGPMDKLAQQAGVGELPKGGGEQATACARRLAEKYGKDALREYVKLHFANYKRV